MPIPIIIGMRILTSLPMPAASPLNLKIQKKIAIVTAPVMMMVAPQPMYFCIAFFTGKLLSVSVFQPFLYCSKFFVKSTDNEDILTKNFHVHGHCVLSYNPQNNFFVILCTISIAFGLASAYTKRVNEIS